jgi:hypothetical protein
MNGAALNPLLGTACFVIACGAMVWAPQNAKATTVTLEALKDNTLIESELGDLSLGASFAFFVGRVGSSGGGTIRRAALAFDIASVVPVGSTITDATLKLYLVQSNNGLQNIKLYRMTADWGEGTSYFGGGSGAPATPNDATWLHRFYPSVFWNQPGGDYDGALLASTNVSAIGYYTWHTPALIAAIQFWTDNPQSNFGFCIKGNEAQMQTAKKFASSEWDSVIQPTPPEVLAQRPKLTITFTEPIKYSPADFNEDGQVDGVDLAILLALWGPCESCITDLSGDGIVNGVDLAMLLAEWG